MSKTLKIAIIGCGGIANGKHLPSLSRQKPLNWSPSAILSKSGPRKPLRNTARKAPRSIRTTASC